MNDFEISFNWQPFMELDQFALLARQDYNLGNKGKWFNLFRGGIIALRARLGGVTVHFRDIHAWGKGRTDQLFTEYHLASLFFNMDSALECFVFALNSLGYGAAATEFVDIEDEKKLRQIGPRNILGPEDYEKAGYDRYFPQLKKCVSGNKDLINKIIDQHDVSKHRQTIFKGGQVRFDPPAGFFKSLGIEDNNANRVLCAPFEEILLRPNPKVPECKHESLPSGKMIKLEDLTRRFRDFMHECAEYAVGDARRNIILNFNEFHK